MTFAVIRPWLIVFALIAAGVYMWNREHRLRGSAELAAEAAQLALKGQIVEGQETKKQLDGSVADLVSQNEALAAALAEAKKAAPDAKAESASRLDTGPLVVHVAPREVASAAPGPPPPAEPAPPTTCALTQQDKVSVTVNVLELQTGKGNTLIVGTADVYRVGPPRTLLAGGRFQSSLSETHELAETSPPRWGVLALGACGSGGCGPGVGVLLPPVTVPLVHWRAEAFLGAVAAPGSVLALGGIGVRW